MRKVKCPDCGETDMLYSVNTTVFFNLNEDNEVELQGSIANDIEDDTQMSDVTCHCLTCGSKFSGGDAECV